ncbi:hypothetical protein LK459_18685 [Gordonia otitidis]|uniref:hypothetical protein n=1 Tax=Gordonia otitidis TaxID=249058 RepID=UPI001D145865|nr:hypothetical protein [Gordonia otitidis]UEA58562.1 hypothetical protein LK459_18685 [Gordonia otitidis]
MMSAEEGADSVDAQHELVARVAALLDEIGDVGDTDDESAVVQVGVTRASVRVIALAEDLRVVSVTQLLALNLPNTDALRDDVEELDATLSFGNLRRSDPTGVTTDVLQYYTFPVGGLADIPLLTVLHIVLSAGDDIARKLVDAS